MVRRWITAAEVLGFRYHFSSAHTTPLTLRIALDSEQNTSLMPRYLDCRTSSKEHVSDCDFVGTVCRAKSVDDVIKNFQSPGYLRRSGDGERGNCRPRDGVGPRTKHHECHP